MSKRILVIFFTLWFGLFPVIVLDAQQNITEKMVKLGEPANHVLTAEKPILLTFEGVSGEVVDILTATADVEDAPDSVLDVFTPDGKRLAYVDDHVTMSTTGMEIMRDAQITNLLLPESGIYTIRVDSFNGVGSGDVEILVAAGDLYEEIISTSNDGIVIEAGLPAGGIYEYIFDADAGITTVHVSISDISGMLDPILVISDASGDLIGVNDDHSSSDLMLNVLDSRIETVSVPDDGLLVIAVRDFLGRAGRFELRIFR